MSLTDELEQLVQHEIAIVMNDGMTYRGMLINYDDETVILENVFEASHGQIDWIKSSNAHEGSGSTLKGYMAWRKITLPKLIARIDRILRIWPWVITDSDNEEYESDG